MLAKDMCSQNQKVGHLICLIHNKRLFDSENFSSFAKFAFQNKQPLLKKQNGARSLQGKNLLRFFAGILFEEGIVFRKYQSLF